MSRKKNTAFDVRISTSQRDDDQPVSMEDFCRYLIQPNAYFFIPCRELWPGTSVNARLPRVPVLTKSGQPKRDKDGKPVYMSPSKWIDDNRRVEQATWHPGLPMFITDRLAVAGGWVEKRGTTSFNLYRAPRIVPGDKSKATPWLDHVYRIYPTTPTTSFVGWRITGNAPATRSTTRCCWAGTRESARTPCCNRSSRPSDRGIFTISHRPISPANSTASSKR